MHNSLNDGGYSILYRLQVTNIVLYSRDAPKNNSYKLARFAIEFMDKLHIQTVLHICNNYFSKRHHFKHFDIQNCA